jgi:hypothetical protein
VKKRGGEKEKGGGGGGGNGIKREKGNIEYDGEGGDMWKFFVVRFLMRIFG